MQRAGVKSLIIDLRGNVGGLVQNATELEQYISGTTDRSPRKRTIIKCLRVEKSLSPYLMTYEVTLGKLLTNGRTSENMKKLSEGGYEIINSALTETQASSASRFTGKV